MSFDEETPATGYYRCIDPIENLNIRVVLKPVKNVFIPLPQFDQDKTASLSEVSSQSTENRSDVEDYTFKWQEKIFSKNEVNYYSNRAHCKTQLHEKYHENVTEILKNSKNYHGKLFTYVDVDNHTVQGKDLNIVEGGNGYISFLAHLLNELELGGANTQDFRNISKRKVVNYSPSEDFKKQHHVIGKSLQRMFIMADLGSSYKDDEKDKSTTVSRELLLCSITYDSINKVLKMTPAFSQSESGRPYIIGRDGPDTRNAYYYWVHHVSVSISAEELINERKIINKILQHQKELRELQTGNEFVVGKPNHLYVTVLGEITSCSEFEYDYLSVHYFIKLTPGWRLDSSQSWFGNTQTARKNSEGVSHFSHLFQIYLICDKKILEEIPSSTPEVYFEILSLDKWNRYRKEGYTYVSMPKNFGVHKFKLGCWRPVTQSIRQQLERFFIGGGPELEDIGFVGTPHLQKESVHSRFGFKTAPCGKLEIRLNVIHQSEAVKTDKERQIDIDGKVLGRLDANTLMGSVNTVLEAFRRARERMLKARMGLEVSEKPFVADLNQAVLSLKSD